MTHIQQFRNHVKNSATEFRRQCIFQARRVTKQVNKQLKQGDKLASSTHYLPHESLGWVNSYRILYIFVLTPRQEFVAWRGVFEHLAWNWGMDNSGYIGEPYSSECLDTMLVLESLLSVIEKRKKRSSGQWAKRRKYAQRVQYHGRSDLYLYEIKYMGPLQAIFLVEKMEIPIQGSGKVRLRQQYVDFVRHTEFFQNSRFQVQMSSHVQLFLDRDFYLPQNLSEDRERYRRCHPELCVKISSKQEGKETRAEQRI